MTTTVRRYRESHAPALAALFHAAVHQGAAGHYTREQLHAWSPAPKDPGELNTRLAPQAVFVAEDETGLAGFMTLEADGHLDMAFVHPRVQGKGVTGLLMDALMDEARSRGMTRLNTEASHPFRRFLERRDWQHIATQEVDCRGVMLTNHRMAIDL